MGRRDGEPGCSGGGAQITTATGGEDQGWFLPKSLGALNGSFNCPADHCRQAGAPLQPCSISHQRSHAHRLSMGLAGGGSGDAAAAPLQATLSVAPPCIDMARFVARKRHRVALLAGNGPSMNLVGSVEARRVQQTMDVWATNQFFVHQALTPDFHHVEIKGYTEAFWLDNFDQAVRARYRARRTLLWAFDERKFRSVNPRKRACRLDGAPGTNASVAAAVRRAGHVCGSNCPQCLKRVLRHTGLDSHSYDELAFGEAPVEFGRCKAGPLAPSLALSKRCHASITTVLSMILRLEYERLYVLGIDLTSTDHFFDVASEYAALHRPDLTRKEAAALMRLAVPNAASVSTRTMETQSDTSRAGHLVARKHLLRKRHTTARAMLAFLPAFLSANALPAVNLSPHSMLRSTSLPTMGLADALSSEDRAVRRQTAARLPTVSASNGTSRTRFSKSPLLLHRIAPLDTSPWRAILPSWEALGAAESVYADADLLAIVGAAFPALALTVAKFRSLVEVTDIARLALMYLHGGVYADLDQELREPNQLRAMLASGLTFIPLEKQRFVGQSILVSPPRRPLWARLAAETVARYGSKCYETMNTGTHLTTELWNKWCIERDAVLSGVVLQSMSGVVTWHHTMNNHSWMPTTTSSRASLQREAGKVGCPFRRTRTPRVKCTGG